MFLSNKNWKINWKVKYKLKSLQFAYLPGAGSGTTSSLTLIYDRIVSFLDKPGAVRVLSIDFTKAFDKLQHQFIIQSAVGFCLPLKCVTWLKSYLSDRLQRVRVGDRFSSWSPPITSGVPQGSVLGPILFCMVIDDFTVACKNSMCFKYADDITILHFLRDSQDDNLQLEWNNVMGWSDAHCLPINFSKSCVMNIISFHN